MRFSRKHFWRMMASLGRIALSTWQGRCNVVYVRSWMRLEVVSGTRCCGVRGVGQM